MNKYKIIVQEILKIEGNSNWPEIVFNSTTGNLSMVGRSIVENAIRFYDPILDWVKDYCKNPAEKTEFHIKLEYFNTSTSKYILSIIDKLSMLHDNGNSVEVYWYSIDEDMEELGEDYKAMIDVPFKLLELTM